MKRAGSPKRTRVEVVQMDRFFLYLPFHYACHRNFFGYVPPQYDVVVRESRGRPDQSSYSELVNRIDAHKDVWFALCDPTFVLHKGLPSQGVSPAILAGIITNAAFWAINHRSYSVKAFRDLAAFAKVISYQPGTTSYRIAHRIFRDSKSTDVSQFIETVNIVGDELMRLKKSDSTTLALSPAILEIDALLGSKGSGDDYDIEIALGTTPEYSNVLVTALISRQDVVAAHPALVHGMLKATQRAMILVRFFEEEVITFAKQYYANFGYRAHGALQRAADADVFPPTIEVSQAHWENAARAAIEADEHKLTAGIEEEVASCYERFIKPYKDLARRAARDEMLGLAPPLDPRQSGRCGWLTPLLVGLLVGLCAIAVAEYLHWVSGIACVFGAAVSVCFWVGFRLKNHKILGALHVALWLLITCVSALLAYLLLVKPGNFQPYMASIITGIVAVFALDCSLLFNVYRQDSKSDE
jgi:hypothetical protein